VHCLADALKVNAVIASPGLFYLLGVSAMVTEL